VDETTVQPDEAHPNRSQLYVRWALRWITAFAATAVALAAAAATHARVAGWIAVATCALLGVMTFVTEAVHVASERSLQAKKSAAFMTARWVATTVAALAGALVVEATISHAAGAILTAVALLALLGGAATFAVRW
jgi:hypothetical protein